MPRIASAISISTRCGRWRDDGAFAIGAPPSSRMAGGSTPRGVFIPMRRNPGSICRPASIRDPIRCRRIRREAFTRLPDDDAFAALEAAPRAAYRAPAGGDARSQAAARRLSSSCFRAFFRRGRVGVLDFTYAEHAACWAAAGAQVDNGRHARRRSRRSTSASSSIPTIRMAGWSSRRTIWSAAAQDMTRKGGLLIVDESFMDFTPEASASLVSPRMEGVVVLRSFGKAYGLRRSAARLRSLCACARRRRCARRSDPGRCRGRRSPSARARLPITGWRDAAAAACAADAARLDALLAGAGFEHHGRNVRCFGCRAMRSAARLVRASRRKRHTDASLRRAARLAAVRSAGGRSRLGAARQPRWRAADGDETTCSRPKPHREAERDLAPAAPSARPSAPRSIARSTRAATCATSFCPTTCRSDVLLRILDAAHHAPSVGFMQPWNFIVVRDVAIRGAVLCGLSTRRRGRGSAGAGAGASLALSQPEAARNSEGAAQYLRHLRPRAATARQASDARSSPTPIF